MFKLTAFFLQDKQKHLINKHSIQVGSDSVQADILAIFEIIQCNFELKMMMMMMMEIFHTRASR